KRGLPSCKKFMGLTSGGEFILFSFEGEPIIFFQMSTRGLEVIFFIESFFSSLNKKWTNRRIGFRTGFCAINRSAFFSFIFILFQTIIINVTLQHKHYSSPRNTWRNFYPHKMPWDSTSSVSLLEKFT